MIDIGSRIKELRKERGWTQEILAQKLDVKQNTISHYESNESRPGFEVLIAIADIFDVSADYLLGRKDY